MSALVSFIIFTRLLITDKRVSLNYSFSGFWPIQIFVVLSLYILGHGIVNRNFNLTHYYWLAGVTLLLAIKCLQTFDYPKTKSVSLNEKKKTYTPFTFYLHRGIILIAFIESAIVIFQWLGFFPSMNELFACTGTWVNPNVTAIFLALTLLSRKPLSDIAYKKNYLNTQLLIVLLAIIMLQCRTAYIIIYIILLGTYKPVTPVIKPLIIRSLSVVLLIIVLALGFKTGSTNSRIQIWKNSLQLIATNPGTGVGFGQFEKEYNAFVVQQNLISNDYVYMPYNDFLELAVEGGIVAVTLWIGFLIALAQKFKNSNYGLTLIISFIIVQLTNFGFQSIPVFALFLIYTGCMLQGKESIKKPEQTLIYRFALKTTFAIATIGAMALLTKVFLIASTFHQSTLVSKKYPPEIAIEKFKVFAEIDFSSNYHENLGDLFMQTRNFHAAKSQYSKALQTTNRPNVLGKYGWCFGNLGQYDSASYCFRIIEKLQPYKYAPRLALLKLYEQQKDTASLKLKAQEIIGMPVKVPSEEIKKIKAEAVKWLQIKL